MAALAMLAALAAPAYAQRAAVPGIESGATTKAVDRQRATAVLNKLPIRFEPTDAKGTFLARGIGPGVQLTGRTIDLSLGSGSHGSNAIRVQFVGARKSSRVTGLDPLPGRINYLYGDDPAKWRTNIRTYARAHTSELYRGIDVDYYGAGDLLEYDFIVRPGARTDSIRLAVSGGAVAISDDGDLVYGDRVLLRKPLAYQIVAGTRRDVSVDYHHRADSTFGFAVGAYDRSESLVIDPVLAYSFTFGGSAADRINDLTVDDSGAVYIGGETYSGDFPTINPAQSDHSAGSLCLDLSTRTSCSDGFLAKLQPDGTGLEYATYMGRTEVFSAVRNIAVDSSHALYFAKYWRHSLSGGISIGFDIGKLSSDGSRLLYLTTLPFYGQVSDIAIGQDGSAYTATWYGSQSAVATLSPIGDNFHFIYTTPLDPTDNSSTIFRAIAIRDNDIFVAGNTNFAGFPITPGAAQTRFASGLDGLILRLTTGGTPKYATFLGGSADETITDLAVGTDGSVYLAGATASEDFPNGSSDIPWDTDPRPRAIVAQLRPDGTSITYATLLSYPQLDYTTYPWVPLKVAVDSGGNAYTSACVPVVPYSPSALSCHYWKVAPSGKAAASTFDPRARLFAMNAAGTTEWFGVDWGDVTVTRYEDLPTITAFTRSVPSPSRFAIPITWSVDVAEGGDVQYSYRRYNAFDGWIEAQPFGSNPTYSWTPASWDVGEHSVCVLTRFVGSLESSGSCVDFIVTGLSFGEPPVLSAAADFNADRRPDLLWINSATGQMAMWNLGGGDHGERVLGGGYLNSPALPAGWRVAGTADIDGDGQTDLFLQSDTGLLGAWLFDGSTLRNGITLTPGQVGDANWQIRAVGDLNHDGHPDLIWQYAPTGQVAVWLMNGTTAIGYIVPNVNAPGGDWEIVGTGDSNRDGERDIFWQQRSTGTLAVWWMNGTSIAGASLLSASPDPKWRVVAVADIDGDAYSDLVLQHTDTRMTGAWYLNHENVRFGVTLIPSSVGDPAWTLVGPR